MAKILKRIIYFCAIAFTFSSCANVVSPSGGPKDTIPPVVVLSTPENLSCGFTTNNINITFDEYVVLDNPSKNILISPPLENAPEYKLHNKTLSIKFKETLRQNTTYSINFGSAIKDLHEGNIFKDYVYVFSTGDIIDTLGLEGYVLSASDHKPQEEFIVALYNNNNDSIVQDSLPFFVKPNYITKTDKTGKFRFSGLKEDNYLLFAIKDSNSNIIFDLPNEDIAFLDSLINPSHHSLDSIALYSFIQEDSIQKLLKKEIVEEGLLRFVFRYPAQDVNIDILETLPDTFSIYPTFSANHDTILWYFTPNKDSLLYTINYDTLINDTTQMSLKPRNIGGSKRKKQDEGRKSLDIKSNISSSKLRPEQDLIISFMEPVTDIILRDTTWFITSKDTIFDDLEFHKIDSFGLRYKFNKDFNPGESYKLIIPDSVFYSFKGITNDTTIISFNVPELSEYGNIFVMVEKPNDVAQLIIELMDEKGKIQEKQIVKGSTKIEFKYLTPKKYKIRAILDKDGNGKWSPGDFGKKLLPEAIHYHKDVFDVKANWDIDLEEVWRF